MSADKKRAPKRPHAVFFYARSAAHYAELHRRAAEEGGLTASLHRRLFTRMEDQALRVATAKKDAKDC